MCKLAKEYGVGCATIHDLMEGKKKQKIGDHVKTMESGPGKRKTLRVRDCPKMENASYMWLMQRRSKHTPVSREIPKAKAIEFYKKITRKDDFPASDSGTHKLDLLVMCKAKNPRAFTNIYLPVCYKNQFKSWVM
ncbi:unnamed protein product [Arctia plantaginis]|uniref:HTH CENPB-type domain-containing protein n=1 Tax=Arctia plantaginis TaxID=874455 RepID=A0A8S1BRE3_ARCPL|nr:unnamed protein product [Arctia plantaginis]